jgi:UDP-glucose 4-epimerase
MAFSDNRILITGGAGFIGSHLADSLCEHNSVIIIDDLSHGNEDWIPSDAAFHHVDLTDRTTIRSVLDRDIDWVFHFAARKNVNDPSPRDQFDTNLTMTYNLLEEMNKLGISQFVFASSSTVYGEAPRPTPETQSFCPISPYGAAKAAEESLCHVYANSHGFTTWLFRFANVVGSRLQPGAVIVDFIQKLRDDPTELEILGNGKQETSYLHIDDCIDAMLFVISETAEPTNIFNLGTTSATNVTEIADIVADGLALGPDYA